MDNRLTFAIPYYAGRDYLAHAIQSVLRQTNPHWALIVCDDGTGDEGIAELVSSYGDTRLAYYKNPSRLGLAGNWNACLSRASDDLVTILHADDELREDYCEVMLKASRDYPGAVAFFCEAVIIDERGRRTFSLPDAVKRLLRPRGSAALVLSGREGIRRLLRGNFIMCPTMCYRRKALGERRFDDRWQFVLDLDFFTRLLLDGEALVGLPARAYAYRRHQASATAQQTKNLGRFLEESQLYDQLAAVARSRDWADVVRVAANKRIIKLHLLYCVLRDAIALRCGDAGKKLSLLRGLA